MNNVSHGLQIAVVTAVGFCMQANAQSAKEWTRACASLIIEGDFRALVHAIRPGGSGLSLSPDTHPWATVSIGLPLVDQNVIYTGLQSEKSPYLSLNFGTVPGERGFDVSVSFPKLELDGARTRSEAEALLANLECRFAIDGGAAEKNSELGVRWSSSDETWFASCSSRFVATTFAIVDVNVVNVVSGAVAYEGRYNASVPPGLMKRINSETQRTLANASVDACYY